MPGRLLGALLLCATMVCHASATPSEAAVLAQLREMWAAAPSVVKLWVDAADACHAPWPGVGCALLAAPTVQSPCFVLDADCTVVALKIPNGNLTGEMPLILAGLANLQHLDLRGNLLEGRVAAELLDSFPRLSFLDLSLNYFTGTIPQPQNATFEYDTWTKNCFSAASSCRLAPQMRPVEDCERQTSLQLQPCASWTRAHLLLLVIVVLVCPIALIAFLSAAAIYYWRSRRLLQPADFWQLRSSSMRVDADEPLRGGVCRQFAYSDLEAATNSFHRSALLGAGTTGLVYRGKLPDGTSVAVKQLNTRNSGVLIDEEFWTEVRARGAIQHANVLPLRGFCKGGSRDPLLVCELMPHGSVLDALLSDATPLRWPRRFSIAHGAALGLEHLHEHCRPPLVHGNLKPSNVLLDRDFTARVGPFGSVRVAKASQRAVVTTLGLDYGVTGRLTAKSDVFSYGMLLLVLVSGRRMLQSSCASPQLLTWMQLLAKAELAELVDPRLQGLFDKHEVSLCAQVVLLCTRIQPELRPSMSEVRRILEGTMQVPISGSLDTPVSSSHTSFVSLSDFSGSFYGTSGSL